jgi:hypothetical protein
MNPPNQNGITRSSGSIESLRTKLAEPAGEPNHAK